MNNKIAAAAFVLTCLAALPARAVDGISVEGGSGSESVKLGRIGAQWNWQKQWFKGPEWHVGGYWDLQAGEWHGNGHAHVTDLGLTPTFRLEKNEGFGPYVEGAIGFHYLSSKDVSAGKQFSTNFQFGDHVAGGVRFGDKGQYDLQLRLQHLSNAGIKHPNPGINFTILRFAYHFQ